MQTVKCPADADPKGEYLPRVEDWDNLKTNTAITKKKTAKQWSTQREKKYDEKFSITAAYRIGRTRTSEILDRGDLPVSHRDPLLEGAHARNIYLEGARSRPEVCVGGRSRRSVQVLESGSRDGRVERRSRQ